MAALCRWTARTVSLLVLSLIVAIAIGEGMPMPFSRHFSPLEIMGFAGIAMIVLGYLCGWFWEMPSALATLAGIALIVAPTLRNGRVTWFFAAMAAPALLYLASWILRRRPSPPDSPSAVP